MLREQNLAECILKLAKKRFRVLSFGYSPFGYQQATNLALLGELDEHCLLLEDGGVHVRVGLNPHALTQPMKSKVRTECIRNIAEIRFRVLKEPGAKQLARQLIVTTPTLRSLASLTSIAFCW